MAERIIETKLASFPIQKGEGVPNHLSPSGTIYNKTKWEILKILTLINSV
jgi:hypothetical protein